MHIKYGIFYLLVALICESKRTSVYVEIVENLARLNYIPKKLIIHVCRSNGDNLWNLSSNNYIYVKYMDIGNLLKFESIMTTNLAILLDLNCKDALNILSKAENLKLFRSHYSWILLNNGYNFNRTNFYVDSHVYVIDSISNSFIISMPYKFNENSTLLSNYMGTWQNGSFTTLNKFSIPRNRSNFMGNVIRASYVFVHEDSLKHMNDYRDRHLDPVGKSCFPVVQALIQALNATEHTVNIYRTWGYPKPNTSNYKNGLIDDLQNNLIDIAGTSIAFTIPRLKILTYISPAPHLKLRFVFKAPRLAYVKNIFTLPFNPRVWYASLGIIVVILLILNIIVRWEWMDPIFHKNIKKLTQILRPRFWDVFQMEVGAITQQGSEAEPKSISGQMVTLFTFILLMFLYNAYCANIVALLHSTAETIQEVKDLLTSDISLGADGNVYSKFFFQYAAETDLVKRKIVDQKLKYYSPEEGVKRMKNEFFAYHGEITTIYKFVADTFQEEEKCALREIKFLPLIHPWLSAPKHTPLKEVLKIAMFKLREAGIVHCQEKRVFVKKPPCINKAGSSLSSAGLNDCYAVYLVCGIGVACSIIVFLSELYYKYYNGRGLRSPIQSIK